MLNESGSQKQINSEKYYVMYESVHMIEGELRHSKMSGYDR